MSKELPVPRTLEFYALLESQVEAKQEVYRLYYVNYHRILEFDGCKDNNIGMINWPCKPFMLPKGMTPTEGFKVLSYLSDYIESREDVGVCSLKSVQMLDSVLDLERFGFTRVKEEDENKILNLFTVSGRLLLFKRSKLYSKYIEWYYENVTLEDVSAIYRKYNMEFKDIEWTDNKSSTRVLKQ